MMLFAIHALDGARGLELRKVHQQSHSTYLQTAPDFGVRIVMSGPLVEDNGTTPKGSLLVVEAESRDHVERFNGSDPFRKAGVWDRVSIAASFKKTG